MKFLSVVGHLGSVRILLGGILISFIIVAFFANYKITLIDGVFEIQPVESPISGILPHFKISGDREIVIACQGEFKLGIERVSNNLVRLNCISPNSQDVLGSKVYRK